MKTLNQKLSLVCGALMISSACFADRESMEKVDERFVSDLSGPQLKSIIDDGYRMIDIEVQDTSPYRYAASFVKNTGKYKKGWWYATDLTWKGVDDFCEKYGARVIDIEVNVKDGKKEFSITTIKNSGDDKVDWWVFDNISFDDLDKELKERKARAIDLDVRVVDGQRRFTGVMIRNTGDFKRNSFVFSNISGEQVKDQIKSKDMRLVDIERIGDDRFAGILEDSSANWWFQTNRKWEDVQNFVAQNVGRIIDIESTGSGSNQRFDFIAIQNANDLEKRVGAQLRAGTDGVRGFYLKQIGGDVLADMASEFRFYPASTIKILEHLYYVYQTDKRGMSRTTSIPLYSDSLSDTHAANGSTITANQTLTTTLQNMMWNSNNVDTNALQDFAGNGNGVTGRKAINDFKKDVLKLSGDLTINHKFGGAGANNDPANVATLKEFGRLYEKIFNTTLLSENGRTYLMNNMLNDTRNTTFDNAVDAVINQEAATLGLAASKITSFRNAVRMVWKPGNWSGSTYVSSYGWISIPVRANNRVGNREYVLGVFIHNASNNTLGTGLSSTILPEIIRDEIRKSLTTW